MLLLFWVISFGLITQNIANKYGIPQLLLFPEYLGDVNFISHVVLGLACGAFVMSFNMSSYIINGYRFPFIATLSKPFLKYCVNNLIIPLSFYTVYVYHLVVYQIHFELVQSIDVFKNVLGFLAGNFVFISISLSYFINTNKSIFKYLKLKEPFQENKYRPIHNLFLSDFKWYKILERNSNWKIETYIAGNFSIRRARSSNHYNQSTLKKVFKQNHLNVSFFALGGLLSVFALGWFIDFPLFEIPAGASIFILLTMVLLLSGAIHNWLKSWSFIGFVLLFFGLNYLSNLPSFQLRSQAFGLDYSLLTKYEPNELKRPVSSSIIEKSLQREEERLTKLQQKVNNDKTLVLINTSGGGLRSGMWTFTILSKLDSLTKGEFSKHTSLITGASGGMIGAAYYRELLIKNQNSTPKFSQNENLTLNISKDILNQLAFSWVVNDFFIRFRNVDYNGLNYPVDRGYFFDKQLIENLDGHLDFAISKNDSLVQDGFIPDMWLTPTNANDGRRFVIANTDTRFISGKSELFSYRNQLIDFRSFFRNNMADSLRYVTALRMNATFPFVLPAISLPTEPQVELVDAGVRDNFGTSLSILYLNSISDWLDNNIEKIVMIRIVDHADEVKVSLQANQNLSNSLLNPVGSVYKNLFNYQRIGQEELYSLLPKNIKSKIKIYDFTLDINKGNKIPLSWHLSASAKAQILNSADDERIMSQLERIRVDLMNE